MAAAMRESKQLNNQYRIVQADGSNGKVASLGAVVSDVRNRRECFFFSSRRRHTRLQGDWSSDVCSSDLGETTQERALDAAWLEGHDPTIAFDNRGRQCDFLFAGQDADTAGELHVQLRRSEERRVGKECRSRWSPYH